MIEIVDLIEEAKKHVGEFTLSEKWMTAGAVSAALSTPAGRIYTGICIDLACGIGFCAEHSAVAQMLKDRETRIEMIVAFSDKGKILPPCGRCRELMFLINGENGNTRVVIETDKTVLLKELLPYRWK
jgi:cytidine deaminase